ncbi:SDR family NAD(P)-dependent oxidoreductase, partial [Halobium palmae]
MSVLDAFRLDGRTSVVTGGNRGIGRAIAEGMAEAGADVVVANRDA